MCSRLRIIGSIILFILKQLFTSLLLLYNEALYYRSERWNFILCSQLNTNFISYLFGLSWIHITSLCCSMKHFFYCNDRDENGWSGGYDVENEMDQVIPFNRLENYKESGKNYCCMGRKFIFRWETLGTPLRKETLRPRSDESYDLYWLQHP